MLKDKKILIFVSGSIAIYKTLFLIRLLRKEGALVLIVATKSALKFITPLSFETLSNTQLLHDDNEDWTNNPHKGQEILQHISLHETSNNEQLRTQIKRFLESQPPRNHIGYAKWADLALFAPASANSINKLACGIADNIYLSCAIALHNIPKLIAPSANTFMLENQITQENLIKLKNQGYTIIQPQHAELACGDIGNGAMANPEEILFKIKQLLSANEYWKDKSVIITGGGSSENIDSVRCVSNHSSGLQACNLTLALYYMGAKVHLISSKLPFILPNDIKITHVASTDDYYHAITQTLHTLRNQHPLNKIYLFMAAAISDYKPLQKEGKLKKKDIGNKMTLELYENKDILASLQDENLIKIAFKAECAKNESKIAKNNAISILETKKCAMVCLNIINDENMSFGKEENAMYFLTKESEFYTQGSKFAVSLRLCQYIQEQGI